MCTFLTIQSTKINLSWRIPAFSCFDADLFVVFPWVKAAHMEQERLIIINIVTCSSLFSGQTCWLGTSHHHPIIIPFKPSIFRVTPTQPDLRGLRWIRPLPCPRPRSGGRTHACLGTGSCQRGSTKPECFGRKRICVHIEPIKYEIMANSCRLQTISNYFKILGTRWIVLPLKNLTHSYGSIGPYSRLQQLIFSTTTHERTVVPMSSPGTLGLIFAQHPCSNQLSEAYTAFQEQTFGALA